MQLVGARVVLRPPDDLDVEHRFRWYADPRVTHYLPLAGKGDLPREEIAAYIARARTDPAAIVDFSIDLRSGQPIGACSLREFDADRRAEISLIIGEPNAWGQGYGTEAMQLLISYGFAELGLNAIWLVVRADNVRAVRLYERLGFQHQETLQAMALVDGVYYDKLVMSKRAAPGE